MLEPYVVFATGLVVILWFIGTGGKFKGKNFVFDKRITQQVDLDSCMRDKNASESDVVGHCSQCKAPFDEINPARRCKKCRV